MTRITLIAGLFCVLVACATAPTPKPITPPIVAICIQLGTVTPAQQQAASATLKVLTAQQQAALLPVFSDYLRMRDADRACLAGAKAPTLTR